PIGELETEEEISNALKRLIAVLEQNDICLDFCDGPYPDQVIYKFITEELLMQEIEKERVFGTTVFIYEEFYPNHKADIERQTKDFLEHWGNRNVERLEGILASDIIAAQNTVISKAELS